ncbi:MAG: YicC family protein [Prevotella sp.]|nr:YicC family protein [Prevotella sp.]
MILSMTGYGKAVATFNEKKISVEIKSLNSKALDLSTRVAPLYREKEMEIRQMIQQKVIRGKVDFAIWIEKDVVTEAAPINVALIENYYNQLQNVAKRLGLSCQEVNGGNIASDWMKVLMRMPDVMSRQEIEELSDEEWTVVRQAIDDALCALVDFRKQEGAALEKKFNEKIDNIEALMLSIEPYEKARVEKIRARIIDGLKAIPEIEYDKNRLEQELIYYIEKLDISEEKQRLANHLNYFRETMAEVEGGQGKKLGFIAQEMGREINTTGSKSNQAEMQNIVVKMKDELEQIKEQVLNAL